MTKNELQQYTEEQQLMMAAGVDMDDYTPKSVTFPKIKIDISKVSNKPSKFYLEEGFGDAAQATDLDKELYIIPIKAQDTRSWFEDGVELPVCASINGVPTVDNPKAANCAKCPHNGYGTECKANVRLFVVYRLDGDKERQPAILKVPPTSIKHWDSYVGMLTRNKPKPLHYFQAEVKISLHHVSKNGFQWDEIIMGAPEKIDIDLLKDVLEQKKLLDRIANDITEHGEPEPTPPDPVRVDQQETNTPAENTDPPQTDEIPF